MKVPVLVKATKASEAGEMPGAKLFAAMAQYNKELAKAGILADAAGLTPSSRGARVRFSGRERIVTDGPFAETKELVAGYWIWKVESLHEAIGWVKRCPNPMHGDSEIEIRPFFETEDFGPALTRDVREQFAADALAQGLNAPTFQAGPDLILAGVNRRYTRESRRGIPQQWADFAPLAASLPQRQGTSFYGVCWSSHSDCSFDYLTGIEVADAADLPASFSTLKLSARRYAVFPHTGHVSTIPKTIDAIWSQWVPNCGLKAAAAAPCFERYTSDFHSATGLGGMEIWIPLEPS